MEDSELRAEIQSLLANGQKIEAVKRYREQAGCSLVQAKEAVEAMERGESSNAQKPQEPQGLAAEVIQILGRGDLLGAVKYYREKTGSSLKDSKDAVERIAAAHGIPTGSGCFGVVLLLTVASLAAWLL